MFITKIEEGTGKKYRIFGDDQFVCSLYEKELKRYHIEEGVEIHDEVILDILDNVIYKRAKERALFLLERRPLSVNMMKDKLHSNDYPIEIIERVVLFLMRYHYLDDEEYTRLYINSYSNKKSRKQMTFALLKKGISKEIIESYFADNEYSEQICFRRQFERYTRGKNLSDYPTRQKVFCYFYNKGFSSNLIDSYIREAESGMLECNM